MPPMRRPTSISPTSSSRPLGGRFSKDKKEGVTTSNQSRCWPASARAESLTFPDIDDERFTYRLGLNYEPNEDLLFFGSYSTGYKSAGYN